MLTLSQVKRNPQILEMISQTEIALAVSGYTEHGLNHSTLVAARARTISKEIGLSKKEQELAAIAAFCHDMGNFLSRSHHHYLGALLFHQVFIKDFMPKEISLIVQAIAYHEKEEMKFSNPVSAVVVLADKSDVRRSRVMARKLDRIKADLHDRVNFATKMSKLGINKKKKRITLTLDIDTNFVSIMEYFEIFTRRMVYCREAAKYLGYQFGLIINKIKLL